MLKITIRKEVCENHNDGYKYFFVTRDGQELEVPNLKQKKDANGVDMYCLSISKFMNSKNYPEIVNESDFGHYPKYISTKKVEEIGINEIDLIEKEIKDKKPTKRYTNEDKRIVDSMSVEESKEYQDLLTQSKEILDRMESLKNQVRERLNKEKLKKQIIDMCFGNNMKFEDIEQVFKEIKGE